MRQVSEQQQGGAEKERINSTASRRGTRIRVLIVAPSLYILGGQAVQAARLLEHFRREPSLEVSFLPVNPRLPGPLAALQRIKYLRTVVTSAAYVCLLLARVRSYDVIHIFSASYFSFILAPTPAILVARFYGKKTILNYRSGEAADHLKRWPRTALPLIRMVDEIVTPSGYLVNVFAQFGFRARSIFNTVDTARFRWRERRPLRPIFLSNRNLEPLYNVGCILRAFAVIQREFPDASLTVAGDGSQRAQLEALAVELNLKHVEFIGRIGNEKMPELYDAADVYLNSPNIDNMPGSVIEAFAAGLPVVTTNAGGIPYIVTDHQTGLLVECEDYEALARGAIELLNDAALAEEITRNARAECEKYKWEAVKHEWLSLYDELAWRKSQVARQQQIDVSKENQLTRQ